MFVVAFPFHAGGAAHFLDQGVAIHHDDEMDPAFLSIPVRWRSNLEQLFDRENADVLDIIRNSEECLVLDGPEDKSEEGGMKCT